MVCKYDWAVFDYQFIEICSLNKGMLKDSYFLSSMKKRKY